MKIKFNELPVNLFAGFLYYSPENRLDQMTDFTGRKTVESGFDMHVSKPGWPLGLRL